MPNPDGSMTDEEKFRAEQALREEHGIHVNISGYGEYTARDPKTGAPVDLTPEQRMLVSEYTANPPPPKE